MLLHLAKNMSARTDELQKPAQRAIAALCCPAALHAKCCNTMKCCSCSALALRQHLHDERLPDHSHSHDAKNQLLTALLPSALY